MVEPAVVRLGLEAVAVISRDALVHAFVADEEAEWRGVTLCTAVPPPPVAPEVGAGFDEAFAGGDEFAIVGGGRWCWGRRGVFFWRRFGHGSLGQKQASPWSVRFGRGSPGTDWKKSFSVGQFVQSELNKYDKELD